MKKNNSFKAFDNRVEIIERKMDKNGYLVLKCNFARTGIQERYGVEISSDFESSKLYKEYRSPSEVFKPEVIDGFKRVVITNEHPNELLTNKNTKYYAVGFVSSNVEIIDNTYLQCEITIYDLATIEDITSGKIELSAGYLYSITMVENQEYDYIQTDIKPNHIALVEAGRCGSSCSLALDQYPILNKGENMIVIFKIKLPDGSDRVIREVEVSDDLAETLQSVADEFYEMSQTQCNASAGDEDVEALKEEVASKDEEIANKDEEIQTLNEAKDKLQAKLDTQQTGMDSKKIQKVAMDLASVMIIAKDCDVKYIGKDILTIKKDVIKKYNPDLNLDGKSSDYIGFAFDNISTQLKGADNSYKTAMTITQSKALDEQAKKVDEARNGFDSKYGGTK